MALMGRPRISIRCSLIAILLLTFAGRPSAAGGSHGAPGHHGYVDTSQGFHHDATHGFHHAPSGNGINYNPGILLGFGVGGFSAYSPPLTVIGGGGFGPFLGPAFPQGFVPFPMGMGMGMGGGGLNLPMPPAGMLDPAAHRPRRTSNPARAKELVGIGDRSYRARNIKRAEEKYNLAIKADPSSPVPHVHLAQVSIARGNYAAAADHLRDAVTVAGDGAWLANTPDIQAIFAEPADFARQVGKIETHLQANPTDRDAWFVLGAETYLSGRARQAFDVFQRLTDRRADEALTAFLDASRPRPAADPQN